MFKKLKKHSSVIFLFFIVILALILRMHQLGEKSFWMDEIWSVTRSQVPLTQILQQKFKYGEASYGYQPLHYLFIHLALSFGKSEFAVRFPSVIFGLLTILLTYQVGKRFFDQKVALIGAFLLTISPLHIHYSQEARYYSYFAFFSLLTLLAFYRLVKEKNKVWLIIFMVTTALNFLLHFLAFLVFLAEITALPILLSKKIGVAKKWLRRSSLLSTLIGIAFGGMIIFFLYHSFPYIKKIQINKPGMILLNLNHLLNEFCGYSITNYKQPGLPWLNLPIILFTTTFLYGMMTSIKKHREQVTISAFWITVPIIVLLIFASRGVGFHARHVIFLLPLYFLMISLGILGFQKNLNGNKAGRLVSLVGLILVFGIISFPLIMADYNTPKEAFREAGHYLMTNVRAGDVIIADAKENTLTALKYYYGFYYGGDNLMKTMADSLLPYSFSPSTPFRRYYVYHDYVNAEKPPDPGRINIADEQIEKIVPIGDMYIYKSKPITLWQEAEGEPVASDGWEISIHYGRSTRGTDSLASPEAKITYKISVPRSGSYDLYACLRWDGIRSLLKYKIDYLSWSKSFRPLLGEPGNQGGFHWKEKKLGTHYLTKGDHLVSFMNFSTGGQFERFQTIDYFYLTLNE